MGPWGPVGAQPEASAGAGSDGDVGTHPGVGPLAGTVFAEFGPLYRALATVGIGPVEADLLEPWQAAAALGLEMPGGAGEAATAEPELTGDALLRERVRRHRAGLPPPTTRQGPRLDPRLRSISALGGAGTGQAAPATEGMG